ncbi:ragulator complex protein LAMTOR1 [Hetaerina americana]|uniref:ragulator complex protein LAMTOR1 n=1 Tax=Hetaerina americana TaxID=62018 RepID=UPI003A7F3AF8
MGCCYSCKEDNNSQSGDVNERTHLLVDPVSNINTIQRVHSDDFIAQYPNSLPKKSDEQSALNRILQETATNVIDVAALDSHNLEQHEYLERMRQYTQRLGAMGANINSRWAGNAAGAGAGGSGTLLAPSGMGGPSTSPSGRMNLCLLTDIPAPEKVLSEDHPNPEDLAIMSNALEKASKALSDLKVEHRENLVVPFRIP